MGLVVLVSFHHCQLPRRSGDRMQPLGFRDPSNVPWSGYLPNNWGSDQVWLAAGRMGVRPPSDGDAARLTLLGWGMADVYRNHVNRIRSSCRSNDHIQRLEWSELCRSWSVNHLMIDDEIRTPHASLTVEIYANGHKSSGRHP